MKHSTATTVSVFYTFGWARFMSAGFFGVGKMDKR